MFSIRPSSSPGRFTVAEAQSCATTLSTNTTWLDGGHDSIEIRRTCSFKALDAKHSNTSVALHTTKTPRSLATHKSASQLRDSFHIWFRYGSSHSRVLRSKPSWLTARREVTTGRSLRPRNTTAASQFLTSSCSSAVNCVIKARNGVVEPIALYFAVP
jgi:hypothetical protein